MKQIAPFRRLRERMSAARHAYNEQLFCILSIYAHGSLAFTSFARTNTTCMAARAVEMWRRSGGDIGLIVVNIIAAMFVIVCLQFRWMC